MRFVSVPLVLTAALAASAALAQPAPPPAPGAPGPLGGVDVGPPPPGGPRPDRPPPPPPPGAHVMIDREANGIVRVDVHCAQQDTTKDCAAIATRLFAETGGGQAK